MWIFDLEILWQFASSWNHKIQNDHSQHENNPCKLFHRFGVLEFSDILVFARIFSRRFWRGKDSIRILILSEVQVLNRQRSKNTKTTLMLYHPAMSRQSVNLSKINDQHLLKRLEPNRNLTEELLVNKFRWFSRSMSSSFTTLSKTRLQPS